MIRVGFTGTRQGMTPAQLRQVEVWLDTARSLARTYGPNARLEFHHGACLGSDAQAARLARGMGFHVVAHPGRPSSGPGEYTDAGSIAVSTEVLAPKPYLERNRAIVQSADWVLATPGEANEKLRSGTWATIRYARDRGVPVVVITP